MDQVSKEKAVARSRTGNELEGTIQNHKARENKQKYLSYFVTLKKTARSPNPPVLLWSLEITRARSPSSLWCSQDMVLPLARRGGGHLVKSDFHLEKSDRNA